MPGNAPQKPGEVNGAGFLCFQSLEDEDLREEWAAMLVVNSRGLPIEFLYSGPLRPTPVQSILYQDRLDQEVRLSLVRSLLRGLRSRVTFVAVEAAELEPSMLDEPGCPLIAVSEEGGEWTRPPGTEASRLHDRLEELVGIAEPLGRARAALAYVVNFERTQASAG